MSGAGWVTLPPNAVGEWFHVGGWEGVRNHVHVQWVHGPALKQGWQRAADPAGEQQAQSAMAAMLSTLVCSPATPPLLPPDRHHRDGPGPLLDQCLPFLSTAVSLSSQIGISVMHLGRFWTKSEWLTTMIAVQVGWAGPAVCSVGWLF